jgi:hypothetical protein
MPARAGRMDQMGTCCLQKTMMKRIDEMVLEFVQKTITKSTRAQQLQNTRDLNAEL